MSSIQTIQFKRGTTQQVLNIVPASGEPVWDRVLGKLYIGDGITSGGILVSSTGGSTGDFVFRSETGQFYSKYNLNNYSNSGNLAGLSGAFNLTGINLQAQVNNLGNGTGNFYRIENVNNYLSSGNTGSLTGAFVTRNEQYLQSNSYSSGNLNILNTGANLNPSGGQLNNFSKFVCTGFFTGVIALNHKTYLPNTPTPNGQIIKLLIEMHSGTNSGHLQIRNNTFGGQIIDLVSGEFNKFVYVKDFIYHSGSPEGQVWEILPSYSDGGDL